MLPRKCLPDGDLILCASLNRTMMTTNVHPLYLPPVVCWLNRTCVRMRRVKGVIFNVLKVTSSLLVLATLFVHVVRLWTAYAWGLLGASWSLMVCITLTGGLFLAARSSERRSRCGDTAVIAHPLSGLSLCHKLIMSFLLLATYTHTWIYYCCCCEEYAVSPLLVCSSKRGPVLFPVLKWTTFVFIWINTVGFARLIPHN